MGEQQFDVIIVGAGFGGIGAAIQLSSLGYEKILILDREDDLGGTWHVNHYPGLSVDQPSPTFSYRFEPNPYWSRMYAPGSELKSYAVHVAEKYDVRRFMRFNTTVEGARWDEDAQVWRVALAGGETLSTQFLIAATGFLCQPKTPDIPGIETFGGRIIHTAAWDDDYLAHRPPGRRHRNRFHRCASRSGAGQGSRRADRVSAHPDLGAAEVRRGVLPCGATAFRPVPGHPARSCAGTPTPSWNGPWSSRCGSTGTSRCSTKPSRSSRGCTGCCSVRNRELSRKLDPDFDFGCKRPTISNDFYRAFTKPHVHLETNGIDRIEPDGIVANDGTKRLIDTLVLATGFDVWEANLPAIEVIGRDGRNLGKWWRETQFQAYEGISMPELPELPVDGQPVRVGGPVVVQHRGVPDAAHGAAFR